MKRDGSGASHLRRKVARTVRRFAMFGPDDCVAVGLSGGKDSRTLLELLWQGLPLGRSTGASRGGLWAIHIDGSHAGLPDQKPILLPWLMGLGVPFRVVPLKLSPREALPLDCHRCSLLRRRALLEATVACGCTHLALGHHGDDAAVTTLLNLLYQGKVETLAPVRDYGALGVRLVRPLLFVTAGDVQRYAVTRPWGVSPALACVQSAHSHRERVSSFLRGLPGRGAAQVRRNLWRAAGGGGVPETDP